MDGPDVSRLNLRREIINNRADNLLGFIMERSEDLDCKKDSEITMRAF